jgi:hypothetical protein
MTRWPDAADAGGKGLGVGIMAELGRHEYVIVDLLGDDVIGVDEPRDAVRGIPEKAVSAAKPPDLERAATRAGAAFDNSRRPDGAIVGSGNPHGGTKCEVQCKWGAAM